MIDQPGNDICDEVVGEELLDEGAAEQLGDHGDDAVEDDEADAGNDEAGAMRDRKVLGEHNVDLKNDHQSGVVDDHNQVVNDHQHNDNNGMAGKDHN